MSDDSFVKYMILCYIFLEALYACVVYTVVGITAEWDRSGPAEALMDIPKEISISASVQEGEGGSGSVRKAQAAIAFFEVCLQQVWHWS